MLRKTDPDLHWHAWIEQRHGHAPPRDHDEGAHPVVVLHSAEAVVHWLEDTIRSAAGADPDADYTDSTTVWRQLADDGQSIITGVGRTTTVTAAARRTTDCACSRPATARTTARTRRDNT